MDGSSSNDLFNFLSNVTRVLSCWASITKPASIKQEEVSAADQTPL